jgi:predicted porin
MGLFTKGNLLFSILLSFSLMTYSDTLFYGKINSSFENTEKDKSSNSDFKNNASRIGVKGNFKIKEGLNISFQIENEIDPTDGRADGDKVFKERNTFIAIEGDLGKVFLGTYDTAFKISQMKVDLFNDTRADIKYILRGENRVNSFFGYTSPEFVQGLNMSFNSVNQSTGNGESASLNYSRDNIKTSIAIEQNLKGYDGERFSIMFPFGGMYFGLLYQSSKKLSNAKSYSGHVISVKRKISNKGSIYAQNAKSDMKIISGSQNSLGYEYKINNSTKMFVHYSRLKQELSIDNEIFTSIGFEYKF